MILPPIAPKAAPDDKDRLSGLPRRYFSSNGRFRRVPRLQQDKYRIGTVEPTVRGHRADIVEPWAPEYRFGTAEPWVRENPA